MIIFLNGSTLSASLCCRYQTRGKLTSNLKPFTLNSVLPEGRGGFSKAKVVAMTLDAFMASVNESISLRHVPTYQTNNAGVQKLLDESEKAVPSLQQPHAAWRQFERSNVKIFL